MAKLKIVGDAAVITSRILTKDIETLQKYKPAALKLVNAETKEETFKIKKGSEPSVSKFGVVFTGTEADGSANVTLSLPTGMTAEKKVEYVKDMFGYALLNLKSLEDQVEGVMNVTAGEFMEMQNSIEVL